MVRLKAHRESFDWNRSRSKLGSLPIPRTTLDHVVQQLSNSLQNRNNIYLRPQMASV